MPPGETNCLTCTSFLLCRLSSSSTPPDLHTSLSLFKNLNLLFLLFHFQFLFTFIIRLLFFYLAICCYLFSRLHFLTFSLSHFSPSACSFMSSYNSSLDACTSLLSPPFSCLLFISTPLSRAPSLPIPTGRGCSPLTWPLMS